MEYKVRRLRTIKQMLEEIKKDDPETCITKYMIMAVVKRDDIFNKFILNKHVYDFDAVLKGLGLIEI